MVADKPLHDSLIDQLGVVWTRPEQVVGDRRVDLAAKPLGDEPAEEGNLAAIHDVAGNEVARDRAQQSLPGQSPHLEVVRNRRREFDEGVVEEWHAYLERV